MNPRQGVPSTVDGCWRAGTYSTLVLCSVIASLANRVARSDMSVASRSGRSVRDVYGQGRLNAGRFGDSRNGSYGQHGGNGDGNAWGGGLRSKLLATGPLLQIVVGRGNW